MSFILENRNVTVTLWRESGRDVYNKATYAAPVTFIARYHERDEIVVDANGRTIISSTTMHTETELFIGDWVLLGTHADLTPPDKARQIEAVSHYRFKTQNADIYRAVI